jgi:alkanesulfonate monooxygenase SsuD/methylene tetrahydromethanopterin reductase-like flavin-dependent oxidoreductase (luciferase family)
MATLGYFLSSEEHDRHELVEAAVLAERAGFRTATISDHFHPWLPEQGQSPFVWTVLGAIARATSMLRVTTAVVCPTLDHHGRYYTVENARLWTLPEVPPPILLSAFGPMSVALAARACEGDIGAWPAKGLIGRYRDLGGRGPALGELKVCWHQSESEAARIAHRGWRHEFVPGQGSQDLPTTTHFASVGHRHRGHGPPAHPLQARPRTASGRDPGLRRRRLRRGPHPPDRPRPARDAALLPAGDPAPVPVTPRGGPGLRR